jgi:two-component system sensor histidine kinase KdpD
LARYLGVSGEEVGRPHSLIQTVIAVPAMIGLASAASWLLFERTDLVNTLMLFVLGSSLCAFYLSRRATVVSALASIAAFDFLFVPPTFSFEVNDSRYLVTFGSLLIVSLVIANLAAQLRKQVRIARQREGHTRSLFELSREFADTHDLDEILAALSARAGLELGIPTRIVRVHDIPPEPAHLPISGAEAQYADRVFIRAGGRSIASLEVGPGSEPRRLGADDRLLLESLASLAAVAVERSLLAQAAETERRRAEMQEVRNTLLSSISHDLRTPLTVILGSATSLLEAGGSLAADTERQLLEGIAGEAERMSGILCNILDMTWLESGAIELNKTWNDLEELFNAARTSLAIPLRLREVSVDVATGLPLLECDGAMISQEIGNLLGNALEHTPEGTPLAVQLGVSGEHAFFRVRDFGPGLPPGKEEEVFQKFYQAHPEAHRSGMGLGLSICKTILSLHGGEIHARNHQPAGAEFWFSLPLSPHQPSVEAS